MEYVFAISVKYLPDFLRIPHDFSSESLLIPFKLCHFLPPMNPQKSPVNSSESLENPYEESLPESPLNIRIDSCFIDNSNFCGDIALAKKTTDYALAFDLKLCVMLIVEEHKPLHP